MLITDAKGASHVKKEATKCDGHGIVFDYVDVLAEAENATAFASCPEFVAFRTYQKDGKKLVSKHKPWTTVGDANNKCVADLRARRKNQIPDRSFKKGADLRCARFPGCGHDRVSQLSKVRLCYGQS